MFVRIYVCPGRPLRVCLDCWVSWHSTAHITCVSAASPEQHESEGTSLPGDAYCFFLQYFRTDLGPLFHILYIPFLLQLVTQMLCVSGLHRWAAALPALLQSVCAEHAGLSQSSNYRLSFPQTGASAQVNLHTITSSPHSCAFKWIIWILLALFFFFFLLFFIKGCKHAIFTVQNSLPIFGNGWWFNFS